MRRESRTFTVDLFKEGETINARDVVCDSAEDRRWIEDTLRDPEDLRELAGRNFSHYRMLLNRAGTLYVRVEGYLVAEQVRGETEVKWHSDKHWRALLKDPG